MKVLIVGKCLYNTTVHVKEGFNEGYLNLFNENKSYVSGFGTVASIMNAKYLNESYLVSTSGDDTISNIIKKHLEENNVNTEYVEKYYDKKSPYSICYINDKTKSLTKHVFDFDKLISKKSEYYITPDIILSDGTDYSASLQAFKKYEGINTFLYTSYANNDIFELAKSAKYIICNKEFCEGVSGVKMDFNNPSTLATNYLEVSKKLPGRNIVVSLDEKGALYVNNNEIKVMPSLKEHIVDQSMCNEVFATAFAYAISKGFDMEKAVSFAIISSSLSYMEDGFNKACNLNEVKNYFNQKYPGGLA